MNFYNTSLAEQETIINFDYMSKEVHIYTSQRAVAKRLIDRVGQPTKIDRVGTAVASCKWILPFSEKRKITKLLSRPLLIGNR